MWGPLGGAFRPLPLGVRLLGLPGPPPTKASPCAPSGHAALPRCGLHWPAGPFREVGGEMTAAPLPVLRQELLSPADADSAGLLCAASSAAARHPHKGGPPGQEGAAAPQGRILENPAGLGRAGPGHLSLLGGGWEGTEQGGWGKRPAKGVLLGRGGS